MLSTFTTLPVLFLLISIYFGSFILAEITPWSSSSKVSIYLLNSPLFKKEHGDLLRNVNAFHSGILFRNEDTNEELVFDYNGLDVLRAVFPLVGDEKVTFHDAAVVQLHDRLDVAYWDEPILILEATGAVVNEFVCWTPTYNSTNGRYELFAVWDSTKTRQQNLDAPIFRGSSCIDFVWRSIQVLRSLGATVTSDTKATHRDLIYFSVDQQPQMIDFNGAEHDRIVKFFETFQLGLLMNRTWGEVMDHLTLLYGNDWYTHHHGQFYKIHLAGERMTFVFDRMIFPAPVPVDHLPRSNAGQCRVGALGAWWTAILVLGTIASVTALTPVLIGASILIVWRIVVASKRRFHSKLDDTTDFDIQ